MTPLRSGSRRSVRAGHAAIVDAVFLDPDERAQIEQVADDAGVPFQGLWPDGTRGRSGGARRASAGRFRCHTRGAETAAGRKPGTLTWPTLDVRGPTERVTAQAHALLGLLTTS